MNCLSCGSPMTLVKGEIAYDSLPGTMLHNIELRVCECGENEVVIPQIAALDRAIAGQLIRKESRLSANEIRFLRKLPGWSGRDFALIMGVEPETISRWESGRLQIGATADRLLRILVSEEAPIEDYRFHELKKIGRAVTQSQFDFDWTATHWACTQARVI